MIERCKKCGSIITKSIKYNGNKSFLEKSCTNIRCSNYKPFVNFIIPKETVENTQKT